MEYKRLKELQASAEPTLKDVIEITSENFLSSSVHSKEIKKMLTSLMEKMDDMSARISVLEAKQASVFQIEIDEDEPEPNDELSLEEELALEEDDD